MCMHMDCACVYAKLTSDSLSCKSTATKEGAIGIGRERVGKAN